LKYLVVIALVALLLVLLLRRLRPYLRIAQEFIKTFRNFQQMSATRANSRNQQPEKLVCCETCGTWIPIGRALAAGSTDSVYCSTDCVSARRSRKRVTS
jgi:type II secretory pathway pseudopilin PulG